jgi:hypothetical protein
MQKFSQLRSNSIPTCSPLSSHQSLLKPFLNIHFLSCVVLSAENSKVYDIDFQLELLDMFSKTKRQG